jgi:hypothetical protein
MGSYEVSRWKVRHDACGKEDLVEGMDHQREREHSCRVSGLLEQGIAADWE